ncbi:Target of Myb protein 1 [Perilla frutescens var. frutescens]|nr:Target of Myb protein 1 [Perilla frutescens var. frutescens]
MTDNLRDKVNQLGERLKIGGSEVGQKLSAGMSSMSFKMKEFFKGPSQIDNLIEEATTEALDEPDWATNLELCEMINHGRINSVEFIRGMKKRIMSMSPRIQYLTLVLLETFVKNCDKAFSEVAAERVLDDMVKLIEDPHTVINNQNKALLLIESWGESNELRCLPIYKETYKSLRSKGVSFPGLNNENLGVLSTPPRSVTASELLQLDHEIPAQRLSAEQTKEALDVARNSIELLNSVLSSSTPEDILRDDLPITLSRQCRKSQYTIQTIIGTAGDNEALLFEALNVNDEIQKVVSKYEDLKKAVMVPQEPQPVLLPVSIEPDDEEQEALIRKQHNSQSGARGRNSEDVMDDLDNMIFGNASSSSSDTKEKQPTKDARVAN